jgi:predicted nucleotidyltransferase
MLSKRDDAMKSTQDVLRILHEAPPRLAREFGVTRLALFGSHARGDQREDSDVDVLVEVAPSIGLRFVDLAERIEALGGVRSDVVSRRALAPRQWAPISSRNWSMSDRPGDLLIEDILERIRRIGRYTRDLDHDAFVQDEKTVDTVVRSLGVNGEAARRVPQEFADCHPGILWQSDRRTTPSASRRPSAAARPTRW